MRSGDRAGERGDRLETPGPKGPAGSDSRRLSLRVADADDLAVLASVLQDAVIAIGDMRYIASDKLFVLLASRFRWEAVFDREAEVEPGDEKEGEADASAFERIHCGVAFEGVEAVKVRGIDMMDRGQFLDLLTLRAEDEGLILTFAGGGAIRLDVPRIKGHMRDMGEPWPTANKPEHELGDGG